MPLISVVGRVYACAPAQGVSGKQCRETELSSPKPWYMGSTTLGVYSNPQHKGLLESNVALFTPVLVPRPGALFRLGPFLFQP